jgi:hypothetical protein
MALFGKKAAGPDPAALPGLLTFFGSYHALRSESALKKAGFAVLLVPGPREISPNCGVALRFEHDRREEVLAVLEASKVQYEAAHLYPHQGPATEGRR